MNIYKSIYKVAVLYVKTYIKAGLARIILPAFKWCYLRPWTGIQEIVKFQVNQNAAAKLRYWLLQNRILHCFRCLATKATLKKAVVEGRQVYLCESCFNIGVTAGTVAPGVDIIRPGVV